MFSPGMVGARDLAHLGRFYDAVLTPLGHARRCEGQDGGGPPGMGWAAPGAGRPTFFVDEPFNRRAASAGNGCMAAFLASFADTVPKAHAAWLAAGGTDEGAPGERPRYRLGYYRAYVRDPEGNKLHTVRRGDLATG